MFLHNKLNYKLYYNILGFVVNWNVQISVESKFGKKRFSIPWQYALQQLIEETKQASSTILVELCGGKARTGECIWYIYYLYININCSTVSKNRNSHFVPSKLISPRVISSVEKG